MYNYKLLFKNIDLKIYIKHTYVCNTEIHINAVENYPLFICKHLIVTNEELIRKAVLLPILLIH